MTISPYLYRGSFGMREPLQLIPAVAVDRQELDDFFGSNGLCAGCYCMYWHKRHAHYERDKGAPNRSDLHMRLDKRDNPGYLAYIGGVPAGWISAGPKSTYERIMLSRVIDKKGTDTPDYWSVVCLYLRTVHRRKGYGGAMLHALLAMLKKQGVHTLEAYPVRPKNPQGYAASFAWTGFVRMYEALGFTERKNELGNRPIYVKKLN